MRVKTKRAIREINVFFEARTYRFWRKVLPMGMSRVLDLLRCFSEWTGLSPEICEDEENESFVTTRIRESHPEGPNAECKNSRERKI